MDGNFSHGKQKKETGWESLSFAKNVKSGAISKQNPVQIAMNGNTNNGSNTVLKQMYYMYIC